MSELTILTAPAPLPQYTTLDALRDAIPSIKDTSQDRLLTRMIAQASAVITKALKGRNLGKGIYSEVFDPTNWRRENPQEMETRLMLSRVPVIEAVTSLTDRTGTAMDPSLYYCDLGSGIITQNPAPNYPLRATGRWLWPVTVVYPAGYDLLNVIPADLEGYAIGMITDAFTDIGRDTSIQQKETMNVASTRYFQRTGASSAAMVLTPDQDEAIQQAYGEVRT